MSVASEAVAGTANGVGMATSPAGLSAIRQPGCAAVIWRRQPPHGFQRWIDTLDPDLLPDARVILSPGDVEGTVQEICDEFAMPVGDERDWLAQDIATLAESFLAVIPAPYLRLRLDVVTGNACRKFHIDAVTARLICTYRGTGTQYGISANGTEPKQVFSVPTGAPIILRGTRWLEEPRVGLLHRSPPIDGSGETRLLLVLDPMTQPSEDI